jgi:hypothetical protein
VELDEHEQELAEQADAAQRAHNEAANTRPVDHEDLYRTALNLSLTNLNLRLYRLETSVRQLQERAIAELEKETEEFKEMARKLAEQRRKEGSGSDA